MRIIELIIVIIAQHSGFSKKTELYTRSISWRNFSNIYNIWYCNSASGDRSKNKRLPNDKFVYSSIVHSNRKVETNQVSIDGEIDKQKSVQGVPWAIVKP